MITIRAFPEVITPERTVLILGAGSSVPSGAPTGAELARRLSKKFEIGEGFELQETCQLIEKERGRKELAQSIQDELKSLTPNAGLLLLPHYNWHSIYTTNFDTLVEQSYAEAGVGLTRIRSNFDYDTVSDATGTILYKLHGCVTQDTGLGHQANMTLTEQDYLAYSDHRQFLFSKLKQDMIDKSCVIVGQSLRDPHLKELIRHVAGLAAASKLHKSIAVYVFEKDEQRRQLVEDLGVQVRFGGIDQFAASLAESAGAPNKKSVEGPRTSLQLSPAVVATASEIRVSALQARASADRIYNGRAATLEDIAAGFTCERDLENTVLAAVLRDRVYAVVSGAYGVGKTTLCRRLCWRLAAPESGFRVWELGSGMPFIFDEWLEVSNELIAAGKRGFLFIDDGQEYGFEIKKFMDNHPERTGTDGLSLIVAANLNDWGPIVKSRELFRVGVVSHLTVLSTGDIDRLCKLVESNVQIASLVDDDFKQLSLANKRKRLIEKCQRDMFVCLKNIFSNDAIDKIMLYEYDKLPLDHQEIYRYVAALDSMGCYVHRQLIIRMLNLEADQISSILTRLEGIIFEYQMADEGGYSGVYRWGTRHRVISQIIRKYKFAGMKSTHELLVELIGGLNPVVPVELRTLRSICVDTGGVKSIKERNLRIELYEQLIDVAPTEHLPWHGLIREYLDADDIDMAEQTIQVFKKGGRRDVSVERFEVRLAVLKSAERYSLPAQDRKAALILARDQARGLVKEKPDNKYVYVTLADVELTMLERYGDDTYAAEAVAGIHEAFTRLLDPWLETKYREYEGKLARLSHRLTPGAKTVGDSA